MGPGSQEKTRKAEAMIKLTGVSVTLPGENGGTQEVLKNINLNIPTGEWLALTGPNGSGKTTLLKALAGVVDLASGSITYQGWAKGDPVFSLVLQDPDNQFVASSVQSELLLSIGSRKTAGGKADAWDTGSREALMHDTMKRFELDAYAGRNPHRLSGGEKQRLAMAIVWLSDPDVLLLDEPVSFLDEYSRSRCTDFVRELHEKGVTVIWVSPGGDELLPAGVIAYLEDGELKFSGARDRFFSFANRNACGHMLPRIFVLGEKIVEALKARETEEYGGKSGVADVRAGGEDSTAPKRSSNQTSHPGKAKVLGYNDVSFAYRSGREVIRNVAFDVISGECLGVTGPSGSGKTTLIELAGGVLKPSSGKIERIRRRRAEGGTTFLSETFYLFQSPERMFFTDSIAAEIAFGLKHIGIDGEDRFSHATHALARVGLDLELLLNRSPFHLSFGEMRRLALAIAISMQPELLLIDEPTSCLDVMGKETVLAVLAAWKEQGSTVMIASHDVDLLVDVCDRILFIEDAGIKDIIELEGSALHSTFRWPGRDMPFALELQEALEASGTSLSPKALSMDLFVENLLSYSQTDPTF
jgi:energy-coupling factor transporter ATP-binding protein EcfA2